MKPIKKEPAKEKLELHPRNLHRERYDFKALIESCPELAPFVGPNKFGETSIDFFNAAAVKALNKALLLHFYQLQYWDIPEQYLCPPIPGRADYIHYIADFLAAKNKGKIPTGKSIRCLDIGVGANCIYPIIGHQSYAWSFVGADIDAKSIAAAQTIIDKNPTLLGAIELRLQANPKHIFEGIIQKEEVFDMTICNPPFHASAEAAKEGSLRKLRNLKGKKTPKLELNFEGQSNELYCEGGEAAFLETMIRESKQFAQSCRYFSSLVSKESNLKTAYKLLKAVAAKEVQTINMAQGNKLSRILVWGF